MKRRKLSFSSKLLHQGSKPVFPIGAVCPPIYLSSTYALGTAERGARLFSRKEEGYLYSRPTNPTATVLETKLTALEGGEAAWVASCGMGAISTFFLHFLKSGDHVVSDKCIYGSTFDLLNRVLPRLGIKTTFVQMTDFKEVRKAIGPKTKILYFETPANPLMKVIDIKKIAHLGKKKKVLVAVDNTFAPPFIQFPLKLGADFVIHSLSKYISGHFDNMGGVVVGPKKEVEAIRWETGFIFGPTINPFASWLAMRGLFTLEVRLKKHCESALKIAQFLEKHPKVTRVYYPGLASHPQHKIAKKQMNGGFGGMLAFELKGGLKTGKHLMNHVKLCTLAVSLGGVLTLIEHPASMTHAEYSKEERGKAGISDGLVRLSVGLEEAKDIIADLDQGM